MASRVGACSWWGRLGLILIFPTAPPEGATSSTVEERCFDLAARLTWCGRAAAHHPSSGGGVLDMFTSRSTSRADMFASRSTSRDDRRVRVDSSRSAPSDEWRQGRWWLGCGFGAIATLMMHGSMSWQTDDCCRLCEGLLALVGRQQRRPWASLFSFTNQVMSSGKRLDPSARSGDGDALPPLSLLFGVPF